MSTVHPFNKHLANETFKYTLWKARKDALLSKLFGKTSKLKIFGEVNSDKTLQKRYLGTINIQTDKITGTVERPNDFDGRFRPLKSHLRERWVGVALRSQGAGWPPIKVIKVGEEFFVVDGHHRTSYARSAGITFMDAEVWEIVQEPVRSEEQVIDAQVKRSKKPVPAIGVPVYECSKRHPMVTS